MSGDALPVWLYTVLLSTIRLGAAWGASPMLTAYRVPAFVRLVTVFALAAVSSAGVATAATAAPGSESEWLRAILSELGVGLFLGLGAHAVLAAFSLTGRLLDVQIGFGIASVFDPVSRSSTSVMGALTGLLGVTLIFVTEAHLALARMVVLSTRMLPLGQVPDVSDGMGALLAVGTLFSTGLALAAPIVVALLLTDLLIGLATRNMPQINVLALSLPVKVGVGCFMLALSVRGWAPLVERHLGVVADVLGAAS